MRWRRPLIKDGKNFFCFLVILCLPTFLFTNVIRDLRICYKHTGSLRTSLAICAAIFQWRDHSGLKWLRKCFSVIHLFKDCLISLFQWKHTKLSLSSCLCCVYSAPHLLGSRRAHSWFPSSAKERHGMALSLRDTLSSWFYSWRLTTEPEQVLKGVSLFI